MHSPTPDNNQSRTGQGPFQDCFTGPALCCHRTSTVLSLDHARTMHGPCRHHAWTMLSSNQARTELRPYYDRALTITALEPCRNWTVQGPCKDHARTVLGPCKDRAVTVLSPCCHRAITALSLNQVKPCFYRQLYAIHTPTWSESLLMASCTTMLCFILYQCIVQPNLILPECTVR